MTRTMAIPSPARSQAALRLALGFVCEHTPESCTRLCALCCCITGCVCALATAIFAFANPSQAATVAALVGVTSALIAAGCVALLSRTRKDPSDGRAEQSETSALLPADAQ